MPAALPAELASLLETHVVGSVERTDGLVTDVVAALNAAQGVAPKGDRVTQQRNSPGPGRPLLRDGVQSDAFK